MNKRTMEEQLHRMKGSSHHDILEALSDGFIETDEAGFVQYCSDKAAVVLGAAAGTMIGRNITEMFFPQHSVPLLSLLAEAGCRPVRTAPSNRSLRLSYINGPVFRILDCLVITLRDPVRIAVTLNDVTETTVLEEQYQLVNSRLKTLLSSINAGILVENEHRKVIVVNEDFCRMFSFENEPARLLGRSCAEELKHSAAQFQDESQLWTRMDEIVSRRVKLENEELPLINGRTYERNYTPIFIDETYKGHLWVYRDITERKNNELRIQQLARLSEENPGPILRVDDRQKVIYANQPAKRMLQEMTGRSGIKVPEQFLPHITLALQYGHAVEQEVSNPRNGAFYLCTFVPFSESRYVNVYVKDITERKRAEEAIINAKQMAEDSMRTKQEFTSRMNHELRTPLNAILGFANLMDATELSEKQQYYVKHTKGSAELLLSLVNDVLDLAKIEGGHIELQPETFDLHGFFEDLRANMLPLALSKRLSLSVVIPPDVPVYVIGMERQLHQIMLNLASNAVKFTDAGSVEITVAVKERNGDQCLIAVDVADTGRGIPEEKLQWIFESFTQVHGARSVFGGTGLGLAIVKHLCELTGGTITVASNEGKGSVFSLLMPFTLPDGEPASLREERQEALLLPFNRPVSVLLVEDNHLNQIVAQSTFELWGITVTVANNGKEAVDLLRDHRYDCVFMDIEMDVMNGYEAASYIRSRLPEPARSVPIAAMTAFVSEEIRLKSRESGMDHFISKPFDAAAVHGLISRIMEGSTEMRERESELVLGRPSPVITMDHINRVTSGNAKYTEIMLSAFTGELPKYIDRLRAAARGQNGTELQRIEHSLKPTWEYFEQHEMKSLMKAVVEKVQRREDVSEELDAVKRIVDAVVEQLQNIRRGLHGGAS